MIQELLAVSSDLSDAVSRIDDAYRTEFSEPFRWRLRNLMRCLRALAQCESFADRGVLLRETARLADGTISLPLTALGIKQADLAGLQRFGISARAGVDGRVSFLITDDDPLPGPLGQVLRLDSDLRRPYRYELADAALLRLTPFREYLTPTQKAALRALFTMPPASVLSVTMPTGSGKSLVFQLGTLYWRERDAHACAIVIVPTISLAQDHERALREIPGLEGSRAITSTQGHHSQDELLIAFNRGEVPILLLSPELALGRFREQLLTAAKPVSEKPLAARGRLAAVFVDEAHIVESWGRSFRPDFQRLPALVAQLRDVNPDLRVALLSATLGEHAREEMRRAYGQHSEMLEIDAQVPRYEFDLVSLPKSTAKERDATVLQLIDRLPRPCILYTTKVEHANRLHRALRTERGYQRIALFTGELADTVDRQRIVHDWSVDRLDLVVATSAFGLGIDKGDVRAVVHACVPESTARYYQEIGRSGRDGHQALALCVWHRSSSSRRKEQDDRSLAYAQATRDWLRVETSLDRWRTILRQQDTIRWYHGRPHLDVRLDALRDALGTQSSDYNRKWNMTLLNLLQRAGAVSIQVLDDNAQHGPVWRVEVLNPRILEQSEQATAVLSEAFELRTSEQKGARDDVTHLIRILSGLQDDCALAELFRAVEVGHPSVEACGRCAWCRELGATPPDHAPFRGLDVTWRSAPVGTTCRLGPIPLLIEPDDPSFSTALTRLLRRLAHTGVEQFVVPDGRGPEAVSALVDSEAHLASVFEAHHLVDGSGWTLANLPTSVLFSNDSQLAEALFRRCTDWKAVYPEQGVAFVARPAMVVRGRPFAQIASTNPPYPESFLDRLSRNSAQ